MFLLYIAAVERIVERHEFNLLGARLVAEKFRGSTKSFQAATANATYDTEQVMRPPKTVPLNITDRPSTTIEPQETMVSSEGSEDESDVQSYTIEVYGVKKKTSEETLHMFFQSRRRSGGGPIEQLWFNKENNSYMITFKDRQGETLLTS